MTVADAAGPVGLACLCIGAAIFGESRDALAWTIIGVAIAVIGVVLLCLSR